MYCDTESGKARLARRHGGMRASAAKPFVFMRALRLSFLGAFCFSAVAHAKSSDTGGFSALHESYPLSMQVHDVEYILASYGAQILYAEDDKKISDKEKLEILLDALALIEQTSYEEHLLAKQASTKSFIHEVQKEAYLIACEGMGGGMGRLGSVRGPALPCFGGLSFDSGIPERDEVPDFKEFGHNQHGLGHLDPLTTPQQNNHKEFSAVAGIVGAAARNYVPVVVALAAAYEYLHQKGLTDWITDHGSDSYYLYKVETHVKNAIQIKKNTRLTQAEKKRQIKIEKSHAHAYNGKVQRRTPSNPQAIDELDVKGLRGRN